MSRAVALLPPKTPRSAFAKLMESETKRAWRLPIGLVVGGCDPDPARGHLWQPPGDEPSRGQARRPHVLRRLLPRRHRPLRFDLGLGQPVDALSFREQGILRRLSTTPVPPLWPTSRSTDRISSHQMEHGPAWATLFGEQSLWSIAWHPRPALDLAKEKGLAKHAGASRLHPYAGSASQLARRRTWNSSSDLNPWSSDRPALRAGCPRVPRAAPSRPRCA